jgi:hypothetical protein
MATKKKKKTVSKGGVKINAIKAEEDKEFERFEPDEWYLGEFEELEADIGQFGPYLKFTFRILNGTLESGEEANGKTCTRLMNAVLSPSTVLWSWLKVFLGKDPEIDQEYDLTSYYGNKYRVLIKDKAKKKGADPDKPVFQFVDTIKRKKPKTKTKKKSDEDDE